MTPRARAYDRAQSLLKLLRSDINADISSTHKTAFAWLKTSQHVEKDNFLPYFQELLEDLIDEERPDAEHVLIQLMIEAAALRRDSKFKGDLINRLRNPYLLLLGKILTWRQAHLGSYVHTVRKCDDELTSTTGTIIESMQQPGTPPHYCASCGATPTSLPSPISDVTADEGPMLEMMVSLLVLFLRSRSFAIHVRDYCTKNSNACTFGGLVQCCVSWKLQRPEFVRFVLPAELRNGRGQRLQHDLQSYTLPDIITTITAWYTDAKTFPFFRTQTASWTLQEDDVITALQHTPFKKGWILVAPHIVASLRALSRFRGGEISTLSWQ